MNNSLSFGFPKGEYNPFPVNTPTFDFEAETFSWAQAQATIGKQDFSNLYKNKKRIDTNDLILSCYNCD